MYKVTVKHKNYEWEIEAHSFFYGVKLAENMHEKMGLIGRTYITGSCGSQTWIR